MTDSDSSHQSEMVVRAPNAAATSAGSALPSDFWVDLFPKGSLKRKAFLLVNVWLAFHLFAILICPASVEPSSPLVQGGFRFAAPYLHLLYLDHGFDFFSPDPGASTLVAYSLELPDGSTQTGRFPDRSTFPRLLYHRYFMLTEFLGNGPEELRPYVERAMARNLCRVTGAARVSLTQVVHELPTEKDIRGGMRLNDPSLLKETPLGTYTPDQLRLPFTPKTADPEKDADESSTSAEEMEAIP